jgi:hypothetical protein
LFDINETRDKILSNDYNTIVINKQINWRFLMNIKNNYQYIKLFLGVAVISLTLFCGGCNNEWLLPEDDDIVEQPAAENNGASLSNPESCRKTRGFRVQGHENDDQNCQQP